MIARARCSRGRRALVAAAFWALGGGAGAQPAGSGEAEPAAAQVPVRPDADAHKLAPVQITGERPNDVQERRNSTASKIVIGREEIDRFGDSTLGDVLKRLPGVTIQGRPGRGGAIRLRGLGNGYTQILLDGERVPRGFSLDSLTPDQIERIEILRAPTAETGARAIAGTINIITRDGYRKRVNDLRLTGRYENGHLRPSTSWTRNIVAGDWTINTSLSAFSYDHDSSFTTTTVDTRLDDGSVTLAQTDDASVRVRGAGVHATGRLQWRGGGGDTLTLTPILVYGNGRSHGDGLLVQTIGALPSPYDSSATETRYSTTLARLNAQWNHRLGGGDRIEWRAGAGQTRAPSRSVRIETTNGALSRTLENTTDSRDTTLTTSGKLVRTVFAEHSLVAGVEAEASRHADRRTTLQDGQPLLTDFGDDLQASSSRLAAYAQDEWEVTPQWALHAGLRWEGIATRGSGAVGEPDATNRSSVWTPLLHTVWKPDPKSRDQVRLSLTRSYRSPALASLVARPSINTRYPVPGPNTPTQPDRAGNADLKPELATGIDLAVERYLPGSGLLSANVFRRNITHYMRSVTTLESVSYATAPRYVLRPQNVGDAVTQGVELEAKFRASEIWDGAPRIDIRANASVFQSRVRNVPGPDNRLDAQPDGTANLGADYRFRGLPLTLGGNLNWTPGYTTRLSDTQTASISRKFLLDAYALWVFSPSAQLRLTASNLDPLDYVTGSGVDGPDLRGVPVREASRTTAPTYLNLQLRLELKL
ncbi:MAG: TonB-dependent receptor [Caldimonas sp.]